MYFNRIKEYLELVKFSHTIFAMPFALIGFFLAIREVNEFSWWILLQVILCMIFARNAAMAFNRYLDRNIDKENPRTKLREIPRGAISASSALVFTSVNGALFMATTYTINSLCFLLSPVALLVILGYSYTKRFTFLCHFVLSLGLSFAPIGAWIAVHGSFSLLPLLFSGIVLFWVSGFDIMYACQDYNFDKQNSLNSLPVLLGVKGALNLSKIIHLVSIFIVVLIGFYLSFSLFYSIGAILFITLLIYQHTLVSDKDLSKINLAFGTTNGIASVLYALCVIVSLYI